jgi:hypothetical protein
MAVYCRAPWFGLIDVQVPVGTQAGARHRRAFVAGSAEALIENPWCSLLGPLSINTSQPFVSGLRHLEKFAVTAQRAVATHLQADQTLP